MFVTTPRVAGAPPGGLSPQQAQVLGGQPLPSSVGPFSPSPSPLTGSVSIAGGVPLSTLAGMINNPAGANGLNTSANGSPITMPSTLNTGALGANALGANTTGGVGEYSSAIGPMQAQPGIWDQLVNAFGGGS
jgi:hypothetical protein